MLLWQFRLYVVIITKLFMHIHCLSHNMQSLKLSFTFIHIIHLLSFHFFFRYLCVHVLCVQHQQQQHKKTLQIFESAVWKRNVGKKAVKWEMPICEMAKSRFASHDKFSHLHTLEPHQKKRRLLVNKLNINIPIKMVSRSCSRTVPLFRN